MESEKKKKAKKVPVTAADFLKEKLKNAVRYFYDLQMLRMQSGGRSKKKAVIAEAHLDEADKHFLALQEEALNTIERDALKEVERLLKMGIPVYERFLKHIRGIGPTLSGVLIAEINIECCNNPSQLWSWCGLAVNNVTHQAVKRVKGEKLHYNPWLKSKLLNGLGESFTKACNVDDAGYYTVRWVSKPSGLPILEEKDAVVKGVVQLTADGTVIKKYKERVPYEGVPYRKFYDDYKHRKENQIVETCMGCCGTGLVDRIDRDEKEGEKEESGVKKPRVKAQCPNCKGKGGPAPWGESQAHRHAAAVRYMVKMFLLDLWREWRKMEGLEVCPSWAEREGIVHHKEEPHYSLDGDDDRPSV
jgi:hypothetical protein